MSANSGRLLQEQKMILTKSLRNEKIHAQLLIM